MFLFGLASDDMPIKPVRRGERARRSADQRGERAFSTRPFSA